MRLRLCAMIALVSLCGCVDSRAKQTEAPVPTAPASTSVMYLNAREPGPTDVDAPKEYTETNSGLKYRILRKASGRKPKSSDEVSVNYRGTLEDGTEFDSSYKRSKSAQFRLNEVVAGWTEGLEYCPEGGMIELDFPAKLGYGEGGRPGIPGGASLHFIVELVEIL